MVALPKPSTPLVSDVRVQQPEGLDANTLFVATRIEPDVLAKVVNAFKKSSVWDARRSKFANVPSTQTTLDKAAQLTRDYVTFFNALGTAVVAAARRRYSLSDKEVRTWRAPHGANGSLELCVANGTVLAQMVILHRAKDEIDEDSIRRCAILATEALFHHPERSRYPVLLICKGKCALVVADHAGAVVATVGDFTRSYVSKVSERSLFRLFCVLLHFHGCARAALGFDQSISKDKNDDEYIVAAGHKRRVLELLGTPEERACYGIIVRRVQGLREDGAKVLYIRDTWVAKKDIEDAAAEDATPSRDKESETVQVNDGDDSTDIIRSGHISVSPPTLLHRRQVQHARPLDHFHSLLELVSAMLDILRTFHAMYEDEQVQLLNITPLIFGLDDVHFKEVKGRTVSSGVCVDFAHVRELTRPPATDFIPHHACASIDVLIALVRKQPRSQTYSDTLESLFYVLCSVCLSASGAGHPHRYTCNVTTDTPLGDWRRSLDAALSSRTELVDIDAFRARVLGGMSSYFGPLHPCLEALHAALCPVLEEPEAEADTGSLYQPAEPQETSDDRKMIYEKFEAALTAALNELSQMEEKAWTPDMVKSKTSAVVRKPRATLRDLPVTSNAAKGSRKKGKNSAQPTTPKLFKTSKRKREDVVADTDADKEDVPPVKKRRAPATSGRVDKVTEPAEKPRGETTRKSARLLKRVG
ncbi:uncharacterized protein SCHCODRAFT_02701920 [Schizophyllum commune H4-8]|nr:uncharacterized protein SCHCODRAFT_02701920 [Schizophyllum commune H4-8]KAI5891050.1 hypothetical protein SCHCODRAFT_02701920 [Schizophyllum commune H4-8]